MAIDLLSTEHLPALRVFVQRHLHSSLFIASNLLRKGPVYDGNPQSGDYYGLLTQDGTCVRGILAHYWNGKLMMQCPEPKQLRQLCRYFQQRCTRPVAGFIGPAEQMELCIDALGLAADSYSLRRRETLMTLPLSAINTDLLQLPAGYRVAQLEDADLPLLSEWLSHYQQEALGDLVEHQSRAGIEQQAQRHRDSQTGHLLIDKHTPVAFAAVNARAFETLQIGPVWTPPEYRNRGYARTLVAAIALAARQRGDTDAVLFTGNAAAHRAYRSIGFADSGSYGLAFLAEPQQLARSG